MNSVNEYPRSCDGGPALGPNELGSHVADDRAASLASCVGLINDNLRRTWSDDETSYKFSIPHDKKWDNAAYRSFSKSEVRKKIAALFKEAGWTEAHWIEKRIWPWTGVVYTLVLKTSG